MGAIEELKASDPMRWVQMMNNIKATAEEIVLKEVVYKSDLFLKNCSTAIFAPIPIAEVLIKKRSS
jgi:hypothetical protein